MAERRRVLLTGAAGRIGTAFRRYTGDRYDLRLGVHHLSKLDDPAGHGVMDLEITGPGACRRACESIETVVHLAAIPTSRVSFYEGLLDSNIKGVYNIFRAAKDQGCQRVIFASSVQAVSGYPLDTQVHPDSPVWPTNMYGVSKCFGEAVARYFAYSEGLSSIVVRVGTFEGEWCKETPTARNLSTFISKRDMSHLLVRCIETPGIQFAIVHGVSNNRFKRLDITSARELLRYEPKDDAFQRFDVNLHYRDEWRTSR